MFVCLFDRDFFVTFHNISIFKYFVSQVHSFLYHSKKNMVWCYCLCCCLWKGWFLVNNGGERQDAVCVNHRLCMINHWLQIQVTWWLVEKELFTLPEHLSLPFVLWCYSSISSKFFLPSISFCLSFDLTIFVCPFCLYKFLKSTWKHLPQRGEHSMISISFYNTVKLELRGHL